MNAKYELVEFDKLPLIKDDFIKRPLAEKLRQFRHFDHLVNEYEYFKESFMAIDLNGDNQLDIFYSGYLGGADDCYTYVFLNDSNELNKIFDRSMGHFLKAVTENGEIKGLIYCHDGPAADCPELCNIDLITFHDQDWSSSNLIRYPCDVQRPTNFFESPISFKVLNENYYLRSHPEIFNNEFGCDIKGNIHYTYKKGAKGKAFSSEIDETGRVWWFVIMDNGIAGWMSSRYVEEQL